MKITVVRLMTNIGLMSMLVMKNDKETRYFTEKGQDIVEITNPDKLDNGNLLESVFQETFKGQVPDEMFDSAMSNRTLDYSKTIDSERFKRDFSLNIMLPSANGQSFDPYTDEEEHSW